MNKPTLGFPRMHVEPGERRDFTPALFQRLKESLSMPVILEHDYGQKLGFTENDYVSVDKNIHFADYQTVMNADLVTNHPHTKTGGSIPDEAGECFVFDVALPNTSHSK
jgi:hypothetical protein